MSRMRSIIPTFILLCCCSLLMISDAELRRKLRLRQKSLQTHYKAVQRRIVYLHNKLRSSVVPPSSNMLLMRWTPEGMKSAQEWAESCDLHYQFNVSSTAQFYHRSEHSKLGPCGHNEFLSKKRIPWDSVLEHWFDERKQFHYGIQNTSEELPQISNYLQLVWAVTSKVGCGFSVCPNYYSYVCHYCPIGRIHGSLGRPYKAGHACSSCPSTCTTTKKPKYPFKLCTNFCPWADRGSNCKEVRKTWHSWLCLDPTSDGRKRAALCEASCLCPKAII